MVKQNPNSKKTRKKKKNKERRLSSAGLSTQKRVSGKGRNASFRSVELDIFRVVTVFSILIERSSETNNNDRRIFKKDKTRQDETEANGDCCLFIYIYKYIYSQSS